MLVYGKNVLKEMEPKKIRKVSLVQGKNDREIISYLENNQIRYEFISMDRMNQLVKGNHQGVLIDMLEYEYYDLNDVFESDFVLILDHLEDPHNLGAIIRTAEAAGLEYIILPKDRSVRVNDTVMKVSAGALDRVKVVLVTNVTKAIETLKEHGYFIYASDLEGNDYRNETYSDKKALIIGNEGSGISQLVKKNCDVIVTIPMNGKVNSLNASVAAGILIFGMMG